MIKEERFGPYLMAISGVPPDFVFFGSTEVRQRMPPNTRLKVPSRVDYGMSLSSARRRLGDRVDARELVLVSTKATPTGVLIGTYRHVGSLRAAP